MCNNQSFGLSGAALGADPVPVVRYAAAGYRADAWAGRQGPSRRNIHRRPDGPHSGGARRTLWPAGAHSIQLICRPTKYKWVPSRSWSASGFLGPGEPATTYSDRSSPGAGGHCRRIVAFATVVVAPVTVAQVAMAMGARRSARTEPQMSGELTLSGKFTNSLRGPPLIGPSLSLVRAERLHFAVAASTCRRAPSGHVLETRKHLTPMIRLAKEQARRLPARPGSAGRLVAALERHAPRT